MINIRLQKYKENRIKGMSKYNAARAAGYSKSTAYQAQKIEDRVKEDIKDAFEQSGLTDKELIKHAMEGLSATNRGAPDWTARHRYFTTILELTDRLKAQINIDNSKHLTNIFLAEKLKEARLRANAGSIPEQT